MQYIHGDINFKLDKSCAVTLGKFDGIHTGHQKLINIVKDKASQLGLLSAVFTFDGIPISILPQQRQHFITTNQERRQICEKMSVDVEVEVPFTDELMKMEPEEFIEKVIVKQLLAKVVVVGTDFRFGKNRAGSAQMLVDVADKYGFEAIIVEKEKYQDREISSTYIREELMQGHMETINVLMGRPYSVTGIVTKGKQLGRTIDVPTINIYPQDNKLLPPNGVYVSQTLIDGIKYYGVTNIGTKPTVNNSSEICVETNLFEFSKNIYGLKIETFLLHFLRAEMKFENIEALSHQMQSDISFAKKMFLIEE